MSYTNEYYEKNKEVILERNRKWREANPELYKEYQVRWRAANEGHTYEVPGGYVKYIGFNHPASAPCGVTNYHRIILWDKLGGKDANCHWCDRPVYWSKKAPKDPEALVSDHINTIKNDNRPENLVPSCQNCNVTRGGGQNRTPSPNADRPCEAVEGCDRKAVSHSKNKKHLWVCVPHYMQDSFGKEFTPLRTYSPRAGINESEKECTGCDQWLPHDAFYIRNGKPKGVCKKCEVKRIQEAKKRRLARAVECAEDGCVEPALTKGKCSMHYSRDWYRNKHGKKTEGNSLNTIKEED